MAAMHMLVNWCCTQIIQCAFMSSHHLCPHTWLRCFCSFESNTRGLPQHETWWPQCASSRRGSLVFSHCCSAVCRRHHPRCTFYVCSSWLPMDKAHEAMDAPSLYILRSIPHHAASVESLTVELHFAWLKLNPEMYSIRSNLDMRMQCGMCGIVQHSMRRGQRWGLGRGWRLQGQRTWSPAALPRGSDRVQSASSSVVHYSLCTLAYGMQVKTYSGEDHAHHQRSSFALPFDVPAVLVRSTLIHVMWCR